MDRGKGLLSYLKPYRKECILSPLFKMIEACFELLVPVVVAALIDRGIGERNESLILRYGLLLFFLAFFGMILAITAQYCAAKAATGFAAALRKALFEKILSFSFSQMDSFGAGTLVTRQSVDVNQVQGSVNMVLRLLLRSPFIVGGAWICAALIDLPASLVFAAVITALILVTFLLMRFSMPRFTSAQKKLDRLALLVRENLSGVRVIRAYGREEKEQEEFSKASKDQYRTILSAAGIQSVLSPLTFLLVNLGTAALIYVGALRFDGGILTQGQVVALVNYMAQILVELIKFANLLAQLPRGITGAKRIAEVLAVRPEEESKGMLPDREAPCAVEFSGVSLRYPNDAEDALTDISFAAGPGEVIGFIGPTASGKSSLVSLIPRFYPSTKGTVSVAGLDVKDWDTAALRQKVGFVFQKTTLLSGSIRYNLCGDRETSEEDVKAALSAAQALSFVEEKHGGLDYVLTEGGRNLSGGQRQRLAIARALVKKPEILILDDATSALDYATEAALFEALKKLDPSPLIFLVSQRESALRLCDRVFWMENGRVERKEERHA